jgi:LAO/AO transport system kinase
MQSQSGISQTWMPPVVKTDSLTGSGISDLIAAIEQFYSWLGEEDRLTLRRRKQWKQRLSGMVQAQLMQELSFQVLSNKRLEEHAQAIVAGMENPFEIAFAIVANLSNPKA